MTIYSQIPLRDLQRLRVVVKNNHMKHYPKENPEVIITYQGVLAKEVEDTFEIENKDKTKISSIKRNKIIKALEEVV